MSVEFTNWTSLVPAWTIQVHIRIDKIFNVVICFLSDFYFDNVLFGKLSLADAVISEKSLDINFPIF